jgi:hypothetical protein
MKNDQPIFQIILRIKIEERISTYSSWQLVFGSSAGFLIKDTHANLACNPNYIELLDG